MAKKTAKNITNAAQTQALAQKILLQNIENLKEKSLIFALEGDLGAGKTTFTKGLGQTLNIRTPIRSPGYIMVTEYPYQYENQTGKIFHIDLWRVQDDAELKTLGIPQLLKPGNIVVIEWAQKASDFIEKLSENPRKVKTVRLHFDYVGEQEREVQIDELN